jgi:hypothetical protein
VCEKQRKSAEKISGGQTCVDLAEKAEKSTLKSSAIDENPLKIAI